MGEGCYKGKCECMYDVKPNGKGCTLCKERCGEFATCDERGKIRTLLNH